MERTEFNIRITDRLRNKSCPPNWYDPILFSILTNSAGGKLLTFGWNSDGQCGRLNKDTILPLDFVSLPNEALQCAAGDTHSLVLTCNNFHCLKS